MRMFALGRASAHSRCSPANRDSNAVTTRMETSSQMALAQELRTNTRPSTCGSPCAVPIDTGRKMFCRTKRAEMQVFCGCISMLARRTRESAARPKSALSESPMVSKYPTASWLVMIIAIGGLLALCIWCMTAWPLGFFFRGNPAPRLSEEPDSRSSCVQCEGMLRFSDGERFGYKKTTGDVLIDPKYERAAPYFSECKAAVQENGLFGYIDCRGLMVIEPRFAGAGPFSGGMAAVHIDGKWGYIDLRGNMKIPPAFDYATTFDEGRALVGVQVQADKRSFVQFLRSQSRSGWVYFEIGVFPKSCG